MADDCLILFGYRVFALAGIVACDNLSGQLIDVASNDTFSLLVDRERRFNGFEAGKLIALQNNPSGRIRYFGRPV
jgi:hypothetical protein